MDLIFLGLALFNLFGVDNIKEDPDPNKLRRYRLMADKTLTCKDCNSEFIFTEGEQAFYKEKGFENEPQRCPDCRRARKMERNNRGGNRNFGGNRW